MKKATSHAHGGNPQRDFTRLGIQEQSITDFSVNINPLGFPESIRSAWISLMEGIGTYPSLQGEGIESYYRKRFHIDASRVLAGNGSTELIYLVPRGLGFRRVAIVTPSYHDYSRASALAGATVVPVPLCPENNFMPPDESRLVEALDQSDALWLGNPNNPTGTFFPADLLLSLADRFTSKWIIVDEAFMLFADAGDRESLFFHHPRENILILHSLTKFYGIPGLRIGAVIGTEKTISRLRFIKEPWTVNHVAERACSLLLDSPEYEEQSRQLVERERIRLDQALGSMKGITPFPARANFILCRWSGSADLDDLMRYLLEQGIYIRDCRNFVGLESHFFRLAVKKPEENDRLIEALASF